MTNTQSKFIHVGHYAAEVPVVLHHSQNGWSPYLTIEDAQKLDKVKQYLTEGKVVEAQKLAKVYELKPV